MVILFFYKTGRRATRAGTARSQPVGPCLGRRPGTRAAEARHGRHVGQIGTARYSPCPARARAGPARWPSIELGRNARNTAGPSMQDTRRTRGAESLTLTLRHRGSNKKTTAGPGPNHNQWPNYYDSIG